MSDDSAAERIRSGATWEHFCDTLKGAGSIITAPSSPDDPFDRAEGFRYLTRILRAALETLVENADPTRPVFHRPIHETAKMGADNPDIQYAIATVSGAHEYRIRGQRNSVHYLGLGSYAGNYGAGGRMGKTGYLEGADLALAADGSFEVVVSRDRRPGNWLELAEDTTFVIVRQMFLDRSREQPAALAIECVGASATAPAPVTPAAIDAGLTAVANLVLGCAALFSSWADGFRQRTNELPRFDPGTSNAAGGDPNITYYHGYWEIGPEQALVIDLVPPDCETWNFQLNNHWMESLDYRYHPITVNKHTARARADGSVRLVVAHRDPGLADANWIDTAGHRRGTMCLRWVRASTQPEPRTRVLSTTELTRS